MWLEIRKWKLLINKKQCCAILLSWDKTGHCKQNNAMTFFSGHLLLSTISTEILYKALMLFTKTQSFLTWLAWGDCSCTLSKMISFLNDLWSFSCPFDVSPDEGNDQYPQLNSDRMAYLVCPHHGSAIKPAYLQNLCLLTPMHKNTTKI